MILQLRTMLEGEGMDAGAESIRWHLQHRTGGLFNGLCKPSWKDWH